MWLTSPRLMGAPSPLPILMHMRLTVALTFGAAAMLGCDTPMEAPVETQTPQFEVAEDISNECYGKIVSFISSTWPFAHGECKCFDPPPGAVALWIERFGESNGVSSVRDLQLLAC
jgi:hypothetical protein